jgi:hypothetical protein
MVRWIFPSCGSQLLNVENVLLPSACEFIPDEVIFGYNARPDFPIDNPLDSIFPGFIETDSIDVLQNVHSGRRLADLEHRAIHKISRTETAERCSVLGKCAKQRLAIFFVSPDKEIQVFRCSRFGVDPESIASHDKVLNGVIVEGA